jgi:GNAT superfamily N-acetyltransferase
VLTIEDVDWHDPLAQQLIGELQQEYVVRYGGPDETAVDGAQFAAPYGAFFVARVEGEAVGCAGLRRHDDAVVEIKRMFVRAAYRRRGHARALLRALEERARASGYMRVILETGMAQPEAIALYESAGYQPIAGFGHYAAEPLSRSFAKDI